MSAFDRLSSALQYHVVNTWGFRSLRPVQELSIGPLLAGNNAVVLAPTAGGKTESAFFPLLSAMDVEDWHPVSVLYMSPIRALLNNQEERIQRYASGMGRRAFVWHGDTGPSARKRFLAAPADILLTTPESLEAMMMSPKIPARRLFAGLRAVVIDEVHAFAGDDRGAHLAALLERLIGFCGRDLQRIGLSATVGNPEEILSWLTGTSARERLVIDPPKEPREAEIALDHVGSLSNAAKVIKALHPGQKRLVFADSRRVVEEVARELRGLGVETYLAHGSLSAAERRDAERAFAEGRDCVIVATSALELGIDVGDLDRVIQIDSPTTVASFLQRMGRTGRRGGAPNYTFLCTKESRTLEAAGLVALYRTGYVEHVRPRRRAAHILAHQLMALCIEHGGIGRGDWYPWIAGAAPFQELEGRDREELVEHMLARGILADHGGKLWLGPEGEKRYGRRNFGELYAVFSTPRMIEVRWGSREIGTVDADFLEAIQEEPGRSAFTLAGQPWQVLGIDWAAGVCAVAPAQDARSARWSGRPGYLRYEHCQAMRSILTGERVDPAWSRRAQNVLGRMREEHGFLKDELSPMIDAGEEITWWTFAGGKANGLLARMIEAEFQGKCTVRNVSITCKEEAGKSRGALEAFVRRLAVEGRPGREDARQHAEGAARGRVSKFEACLTERLLQDLLAETVVDAEGARKASRASYGVESAWNQSR